MKAAKRSTAAAKPTLPTKVRIVYRGELQSQEFADGVRAFAALLERMHNAHDLPFPLSADWSKRGEFIDDWIRAELAKAGDRRDGMLAAIAGFLNEYTQDVEPEIGSWQPLAFVPYVDNEGRDQPHDESQFLDVAGMPVSVAPDLTTHKWNKNDARYFSTDIARILGKPISRRKFDAMRRQAETASSGGEE